MYTAFCAVVTCHPCRAGEQRIYNVTYMNWRFKSDAAYLKRKANYLRQTVRVTGLGVKPFEHSVAILEQFYDLMKNAVVGKDFIPWQTTFYEGMKAVDASARYFTPRKFVPNEPGLPFAIGVDPHGKLADIRGQDLIHGQDNKVDFLKEFKTAKGQVK